MEGEHQLLVIQGARRVSMLASPFPLVFQNMTLNFNTGRTRRVFYIPNVNLE